ncbi:MAG: alpha-1,2-fucosyltransferase [Lentisphaerae bacterium]|nr:alpha-1,2-fucosyltransferase [Lentisphaerota bacterium]
MIIVKIIGGLGNQMFQYAAARRLAEKHSAVLKLDITRFEEYKLHKYGLHCFQIMECMATQAEIESIRGNQNILSRLKRKVSSKLGFNNPKKRRWIFEKQFHFDAEILEAPDNVILEGYWQSEKYFADIADILRREFVIKYEQDIQSRKFADLIQSTESVSLHVRRTDYVQDVSTNRLFGTCDRDYYGLCVRYIGDRISNPHLFVFSDDPQWAKDNLEFDFPMTFVDCNDASRNYEDLRLMSLCKHNIIANSSFSWWGGWLNANPDKIIIAPQSWFKDGSRNTKDLIPDQWIKL